MNRILELRNKMRMTQEEFADFCDIARSSIARYEASGNVSRANAEKIARACNVSVSYVIGDTSADTPAPSLSEADVNRIARQVAQMNRDPQDGEDDDVWAIREHLRRDPSYRLLFDAADKATPEHLRAAAAVLKALGGEENED